MKPMASDVRFAQICLNSGKAYTSEKPLLEKVAAGKEISNDELRKFWSITGGAPSVITPIMDRHITKFGKDDIVTRTDTNVDYRVNSISNFDDFYCGVAIDKKDHPYYHCIPVDGGESIYIPEKLLVRYNGDK